MPFYLTFYEKNADFYGFSAQKYMKNITKS